MPPSTSRLRKAAAFTGVSFAAIAAGVLLAPAAFAHHPEVTGSANCSGVVTFTSEAWATSDPAARTNSEIGIEYSVDGGAYTALPQKAAYHYDAANHFQFTDTLTPAAGWATVKLRATALANWGNGVASGSSTESGIITPATGCAVPTATIADASCAEGGAVVHLANTGDAPVDFTIAVPGSPDEVVTVAGDDAVDHAVALPADTTSTITVSAPGMADVTKDVSYHCAHAVPSATVADASCAEGGAVVHLANAGDAPVDFTIAVPGSPDQVVTVAGGDDVDVPTAVPSGSTTTITVSAPGSDDVTKDVSWSCVAPAPPPEVPAPVFFAAPVVEETPVVEIPVAATVTPVTEVVAAPAEAEAAPTPAVLPAEETAPAPAGVLAAEVAAPSGSLPFTGADTGTLALTAIGTLLAGLGLMVAGRRTRRA